MTRSRRAVSMLILACVMRVSEASAFSVPIHREITNSELATISADVDGNPDTFRARALDEIANANASTDDGLSAAAFAPARHFTDETFSSSTQRLKDLHDQILTKLTDERPDGERARELLGTALHTVQDFYSHSNWVEQGNTGIVATFGTGTLTDPASSFHPCPTDASVLASGGGGGNTSGYANLTSLVCLSVPTGKCSHGDYSDSCKGINKDKPDQGGPGMHAKAKALAEAATKAYAEAIVTAIAGNAKALRALFDLRGTIGFVIDDTGSMSEEIDGVKAVVTALVNVLNTFPLTRPDTWLMERFGDPDVGPPLVTDDAGFLLFAVNGLFAHGGGDCPELSQTGLLEAIDKASPDSRLFLFTDASAKDSGLVNAVIGRAQAKTIRLVYALTGSCSPIDTAYIRGAEETGGQLFFLDQFQIPLLFDLVKPQLSGDLVTISSAKGTLEGLPKLFDLPVDSTLTRLVVSVAIDAGGVVSLRRPSGDLVGPSDPDAKITELTSSTILTIEAPPPGTWQLQIAGTGSYSVLMDGNSAVDFHRFDFVAPNADIHGGFFPIPGQPLANAVSTGEATLLGPFGTASFKLVDEQGGPLQELSLTKNFPNGAPDHFLGSFPLPAVPFRVVAVGKDEAGFDYARQFPTLYRAQVVGVTVQGDGGGTVMAGQPGTFKFTVTNFGTAATFRLVASNSLGSATVEPVSVTLDAGASSIVDVDVLVPAGTPDGTETSITLTATNDGDATVFNTATLFVTVVSNRPPICDAAQPSGPLLWPPNHKLHPVSIANVSDPDGDPVSVTITSVTQDEVVRGTGAGDASPDAVLVGTAAAELRAERSGTGNGRVYRLAFTASDGKGGQCSGSVTVCVPHDEGKAECIEDTSTVDATAG